MMNHYWQLLKKNSIDCQIMEDSELEQYTIRKTTNNS